MGVIRLHRAERRCIGSPASEVIHLVGGLRGYTCPKTLQVIARERLLVDAEKLRRCGSKAVRKLPATEARCRLGEA